jgi:FixJ family two-component response regulator
MLRRTKRTPEQPAYWPKGQLDGQSNPTAQSLMTMAFPQIAVVDDDPAVLKALSRLLRSRSLHVHTYGSGQEFLASLANGLPACLIVDFQMPEMNGLELQQQLLSNGIKIPTILITAHGDVALRDHSGLVASLRKPIQQQALFEAIERAIPRPRSNLDDQGT